MGSSPQRRCPRCGMPVAQRAENCLMCGALLKEKKRKEIRLPTGDLLLPLLLVAAVAAAWLWKPWQARPADTLAAVSATPSRTPSPVPTATFTVAPTVTPLDTPVSTPTPTLPPNQAMHTVESGETISSIAKQYGTTVSAVLLANNLKATTIIKPGATLRIPLPVADLPTPAPTLPPSPTPMTYVVKAGDNLSTIAAKFDTTAAVLMQANGITDATNIHVGARLRIVRPEDVTPEPTPLPYTVYRVESGDTLSDIASKYKVTVSDLKRTNNLKTDFLRVGQQLTIPTGPAGSVPAPTAVPTDLPQASATPVPTLAAPTTLTSPLTMTEMATQTASALVLIPTEAPEATADGLAASLLVPADGAVFEGRDSVILLIWTSVGILDEDEWYVVRLRWADAEPGEALLYWTKATSFRVPSDAYAPGSGESQRWRWRVLVMRRTSTAEDGTWIGEEIRPASATRAFYWK